MRTNRRTFLKQIGSAALAIALKPISSAARNFPKTSRRVAILHTNDVHSHIDPFPPNDAKYPNLGGFARRKAYIESVRNQGIETLVVECGDMFQGTPYFNFYGGRLEIELMNQMHVDAVTIGNHEFDNGIDAFADRMSEANFPFLNANYDFADARAAQLVEPWRIFERAGLRIGFFGLGVKIEGLIDPKNAGGTVYRDPISAAQRAADELRSQGCDVVVALSHLGYEMSEQPDDKQVAAATTGIDIILGGHTHTFLPAPVVVTNAEGAQVIVNQVGYGGINVGRIDIVNDGIQSRIEFDANRIIS